MKKLWGATVVGLMVLVGHAASARADLAAAYVQGHGGLDTNAASAPSNTPGSATGIGYRLGARLLIFEGYFDYTTFGQGVSVSRGIFGLRAGIGWNDVRLVLRAGGGVIDEDGGALTGRSPVTPQRRGAVGRIGAAVEAKVAPMLLVGVGLDGERFALPGPSGGFTSGDAVVGSSVFANLHVMFELGI